MNERYACLNITRFGFLGPALAAFYNFVMDFFLLLNSSRLFNGRKTTRIPITND
jgi:hypothetical protein